MSIQRYDSGRLAKAGTSPTGGARVVANVARTGIQLYKMTDGTTRREYRSPAEVFSPATLASYVGTVLTIGHPPAGVTPANYQKEAAGNVIAPTRVKGDDGHEYIAALCDVNRADAIEKVDRGELSELSSGYRCDWDATPGTVPVGEAQAGEHFDGSQRNIIANHNAMLPEGRARAGRGARFQTDSAELDADGNQLTDSIEQKKEPHMKFIVDGIEYEAGPALQVAISAYETKAKQDGVKLAEQTTARATSDAKADAATAAKTVAEAKVTPAAIAALVGDEIAFRASVSPILDEVDAKTKAVTAFKFDGKSRRDVQAAVVKKMSNKDMKSDADDLYVSAYFDAALEQHKKDEADRVARGEKSESYVAPKTVTTDANDDWRMDEVKWAAHLNGFLNKDLNAPAAK